MIVKRNPKEDHLAADGILPNSDQPIQVSDI